MNTIAKFTGRPVKVGNSRGFTVPVRQTDGSLDENKTYFVTIQELTEEEEDEATQ
jgi:hypothetical protein